MLLRPGSAAACKGTPCPPTKAALLASLNRLEATGSGQGMPALTTQNRLARLAVPLRSLQVLPFRAFASSTLPPWSWPDASLFPPEDNVADRESWPVRYHGNVTF